MTRSPSLYPQLAAAFLLAMALAFLSGPARAQEASGTDGGERAAISVFAPPSMETALRDVAENFADSAGGSSGEVSFTFANASDLAARIAGGETADLFISDSPQWIEWLTERRHDLQAADGRPIARDNLVVAGESGGVPAGTPAIALGEGRFAMGDPNGVPVGDYARQALRSTGLWNAVEDRARYAPSSIAAIEALEDGEVERAIVYASDLQSRSGLSLIYRFGPDTHHPIIISAIRVPGGAQGGSGAFLDFLLSGVGQSTLAASGLVPVSDSEPNDEGATFGSPIPR